jgi:pimeloyl-ACP methyl ester carboxylesterase
MPEQFCDVGRGITLCYETFGDPGSPPMVLIMGLGTQMIGWPEEFCEQLAGHGYHVIRFDNRDSGRSTQIPGRPPPLGQLLQRRIDPVLYTLTDMADDALGLMRALELEPAHVVGASMGGMIAQTLAAEHPEAVRSLVSIMSNTGSRWSGQPAPRMYRFLVRRAPDDRAGFVEHLDTVFAAIGSRGLPRDSARVRDIAGRSYDRGHDPAASGRQLGAITASGDRTAALRRITAPTLVIHGTDDRLVRPSGGRATARAIPGAQLLMINGMGHDLPEAAWPQLVGAIVQHAGAADGTAAAAVGSTATR